MSDQINQSGKRLAVIGSKSCTDKDYVFRVLDKNKDKIKIIVSGEMDGPDTFAVEWARKQGIPFLTFPAKWRNENGQVDMGAGLRRVRYMFQYSDAVLAFWDGVSTGTNNYLTIAEQLGKPAKVIKFDAASMPKLEEPVKRRGRKKKEAVSEVEEPAAQAPVNSQPDPVDLLTDDSTLSWEKEDTL